MAFEGDIGAPKVGSFSGSALFFETNTVLWRSRPWPYRGIAHYRASWPAACATGEPALQNMALTAVPTHNGHIPTDMPSAAGCQRRLRALAGRFSTCA